MVDTWRGIYPITAFVGDALRRKIKSGTEAALSIPESTLLTVCEFWASVTSGTLFDHIWQDPVAQVRLAQRAFKRLGAVQVASKLRISLAQLADSPSPAATQKIAARLEEELTRTDDPVDALIARFALEQIDIDAPKP